MAKRLKAPSVGKRRCGFIVSLDEMTANDRADVSKFMQWLDVERARREGADSNACDLLEQAIYPGGVGRPPSGGAPDA